MSNTKENLSDLGTVPSSAIAVVKDTRAGRIIKLLKKKKKKPQEK